MNPVIKNTIIIIINAHTNPDPLHARLKVVIIVGHAFQDPKNKQFMLCDEEMLNLFGKIFLFFHLMCSPLFLSMNESRDGARVVVFLWKLCQLLVTLTSPLHVPTGVSLSGCMPAARALRLSLLQGSHRFWNPGKVLGWDVRSRPILIVTN